MLGFLPLIQEIRDFISRHKAQGACREFKAESRIDWPPAGPRDIVLMPDLALELGHPEEASLCFLLWTTELKEINDGNITLIGPDIPEATGSRLPFGKVILAAIEAEDEDYAYELYRKMDLARFDLSLKGFMLRATSQYMREWSRISREAVQNGFSFQILGSALIQALKRIQGVRAAEVLFITHSGQAIAGLQETGHKANRLIQAMHKMIHEMDPDCDTCEYQDVCGSAAEMKRLRNTLAERSRKF